MRIHHLEVTAFGPFAGTESVDFDDLTGAGLFLLCGPTGAGKTSILDAVCFGLYGEVPGDRNSAKRLRSDHARAGVAPAVRLEVTINGRRFRIARSPAWQRPKQRGNGTTTAPAKVTLEEHLDGSWVHLSSRLDETGHLVTELLGMNVTQFTQVAMLPQGRFQSFLRARSDERHKVLQKLFRTSRFEDIERWLVSHRQTLKATTKGHQDAVASVVSRLSEASGTDVPDDWDLHDLATPAEDGRVGKWAAMLVSTAGADHDAVVEELRQVMADVDRARAAHDRARRTVELRGRHAEATRIEQSLSETRQEADRARNRLDAARRAASVIPLIHVAGEASRAAEAAQHSLGDVLAEAALRLGTDAEAFSPDELAAAEREAHEAATFARALLPREAELRTAQQTVEQTSTSLDELTVEAAELQERCAAVPARLAELRTRLSEQVALANNLESVTVLVEQLEAQLGAAERVAALTVEIDEARTLLQSRVDVAQALREKMHDIREARINGIAAELAAALASGDCCPVCGSADHPAVARPVKGAPSQLDEEDARTAYEDADFTRQAQAEAVATLERNKALATQAAGGKTVDTLGSELRGVRNRLTVCRAADADRDRLAARIDALETERDNLERRSQDVLSRTAALSEQRTHAQHTVQKISAELATLFATQEVADSIERLIEVQSAAGLVFARAREALADRDAAAARADEARTQALDCAQEHGFDTTEAAAAAALGATDIGALEDELRAREVLTAKARSVLADPEVAAVLELELPDLAALELTTESAESALSESGARARLAETRVRRLAKLEQELTCQLDAWSPTRSAYAVAQSISTFAEGKGGDNALQMRLSAYVLASRLQQVVAAANERLATMSDERYTLEHSAARGVGEQRGGLSLLVRDEWTGESRDPATLSGGETFVASLALALGLADVVTQEAGGSNIDTLFIDEGFGSLDPETLDDVMNTLDGLRDGGRVVGIVSHVPEMRGRITSQLQIRKDRTGSRVVAARENP